MSNQELKTILYAEDEEDIRAIAQIALEDIGGFTVRYCSNGRKIMDVAKEFKSRIFKKLSQSDSTTTRGNVLTRLG
ncbi:MAG: hypothetical protein HYX60_08840 [Legionella longbeachae]|nr:hypothetical protein [Legionella longbeachae]